MISNQIDFFIPRFHSQRRNSRWPPFTPIAADHAHHRSVGVFMDRFLFLHSRIYIDVFLVFCPTLVFVGFLFFLAWQLGFLLVRLALVCYLCGFGFHLICTGCLHISALIYCCGERGKCDSS